MQKKYTEIIGKLQSYFSQNASKYDIDYVLVYGSLIKGYFRRDSDIDIAIMFKNKENILDKVIEITLEITDLLKCNQIDVKALNTADLLFTYEVFSQGKLIYASNVRHFIRDSVKLIDLYLDYEPSLRYHFRRLCSRILRET